jgi:hypothetical protein
MSDTYKELMFVRSQQIQQRSTREPWQYLHERLRTRATNSIQSIREPTRITTPSWYTYDASEILDISDAVAVCTSTCKHEMPYQIFVGKRGKQFGVESTADTLKRRVYELHDLGRELTDIEKNLIYDNI